MQMVASSHPRRICSHILAFEGDSQVADAGSTNLQHWQLIVHTSNLLQAILKLS